MHVKIILVVDIIKGKWKMKQLNSSWQLFILAAIIVAIIVLVAQDTYDLDLLVGLNTLQFLGG